VQQLETVRHVISMHSWIISAYVNVKHTGQALTVEHTYSQDIAMLSVTVNASAPRQLTAFNAYPTLIVIATQLASATNSGPEMTVVYVSTWKLATQSVTTVMAVQAQLVRTVLSVTTTLSVTSKDTVSVKKDSTETTVTHIPALAIQCAEATMMLMDTIWAMTVMVQLPVTASNAVIILPQMRTSTVAVNVTNSGLAQHVKTSTPHAIQSVLAATAVQHAIAKSVWSTPILKTTPVSVMKTGVEKTALFTRANVILTVWLPTTVTDQKIVTVTTVPIMPNLMSATIAYASKTIPVWDVLSTLVHVTQFVIPATDQMQWTVLPV